ncbi:hypothetical protein ANAPC2_00899 [Anaplasma phagocytophilum]|nr:hypothetical protein ANAPC2_00899 [Anaplasma phagocytophilum]SBO32556.1 hypothetical protein ANAPC4_00850 [Anaplasma phagocytophilum]
MMLLLIRKKGLVLLLLNTKVKTLFGLLRLLSFLVPALIRRFVNCPTVLNMEKRDMLGLIPVV